MSKKISHSYVLAAITQARSALKEIKLTRSVVIANKGVLQALETRAPLTGDEQTRKISALLERTSSLTTELETLKRELHPKQRLFSRTHGNFKRAENSRIEKRLFAPVRVLLRKMMRGLASMFLLSRAVEDLQISAGALHFNHLDEEISCLTGRIWEVARELERGVVPQKTQPMALTGEIYFRARMDYLTTEKSLFSPEAKWLSEESTIFVNSRLKLPSPGRRQMELTNARLLPSGALFSDEGLTLVHASLDPDNYFFKGSREYIQPDFNKVDVQVRRIGPVVTRLPEAVFIYCRDSKNPYHWLMEGMPTALEVAKTFSKDIPVVVRGPISTEYWNMLRRFLRNPIFVLDGSSLSEFSVKKLFCRTAPTHTVDSFSPRYRSAFQSFDADLLRELRSTLLQFVEDPPISGGRIFLRRTSSHRGLRSQNTFEEIARNRGYHVVDPAALTWQQQIGIFAKNEIFVGPGGGVMGNYLFANHGARIGQIVAEQNKLGIGPAVIAQIPGAEVHSLIGKSRYSYKFANAMDWQHADFSARAWAFRRFLQILEA